VRAGGRREGATQRAVVHLAAATVAAIAVVIAPTYDTLPPPSSSQVNGYTPPLDAMRVHMRYQAPSKRRPVRVECATRQLWGPTTRRLPGGKR
jgi:hypothetical protein